MPEVDLARKKHGRDDLAAGRKFRLVAAVTTRSARSSGRNPGLASNTGPGPNAHTRYGFLENALKSNLVTDMLYHMDFSQKRCIRK